MKVRPDLTLNKDFEDLLRQRCGGNPNLPGVMFLQSTPEELHDYFIRILSENGMYSGDRFFILPLALYDTQLAGTHKIAASRFMQWVAKRASVKRLVCVGAQAAMMLMDLPKQPMMASASGKILHHVSLGPNRPIMIMPSLEPLQKLNDSDYFVRSKAQSYETRLLRLIPALKAFLYEN